MIRIRFKKIILKITLMLASIIVLFSYLFPDDNIAFITLAILAIVAFLTERKSRIRPDNVLIIWGVYYLFCIFSLITSIAQANSIKTLLVESCILFTTFLLREQQYDWFSFFIKVLLVLSGIHVMGVYLQVLAPSFVDEINATILSPAALEINRGLLSGHCFAGITGQTGTTAFNITIFLAISFCKFTNSKEKKMCWLIAFFIGMISLLLTVKRGLVIANIVALLYVTYSYGKEVQKRIFKIIPALIFLVVSASFIIAFIPNVENIVNRFLNGGISGRDTNYEVMFLMFLQHPFLGNGIGTVGEFGFTAHNEYLRALCEVGVIGTTAFLSALVFSFHSIQTGIRVCLKNMKDTSFYKYLMPLYLSLYLQVFYIVYACSGNPLSSHDQLLMYHFAITIGLFSIQQMRFAQLRYGENRNESNKNILL